MVEKYRDMMVADGYEPDSSTQKALVLAYSKAGQFEKAEGGAALQRFFVGFWML
jgi:hypothetical protein